MSGRLARFARGWGSACLDFLYPPICALCQARLYDEEKTICGGCIGAMRLGGTWQCSVCGGRGRGAEPTPGRKCRLCPPAGAGWGGAAAVTGYFARSAQCIYLFKYGRRREVGEAMAAMMAAELPEALGDVGRRMDMVMPVPIHWRRRIARGFNQSDLLATGLARALDLESRRNILKRTKNTKRQALLPRDRRAENVRGAFRVADPRAIEGAGILLVDDVVTTAETIGECARVLREAGAREVWVAAFARTGIGGPELDDDQWLIDPAGL
jgi:ComF family protein